MTPKELCDLAAKINAAVPGLVPDFKEIGRYLPVLYDQHERRWEDDDAAAMMLGRCWAWVRGYSCQRCGRGISEYQYYHQTFPICEGRQ